MRVSQRRTTKFVQTLSDNFLLSVSMGHFGKAQSPQSQAELVKAMQDVGIVSCQKVADTLTSIDRKLFVPLDMKEKAYSQGPVRIGACEGEVMTAPDMHASALEVLRILPGDACLDVGCGTGYLIACMAHLSGRTGVAVGMDRSAELIGFAEGEAMKAVQKALGGALLSPIRFLCHQMESDSEIRDLYLLLEQQPEQPSAFKTFQKIHCGFSFPQVPQGLVNLLEARSRSEEARLVVPVGVPGSEQDLVVVRKDSNNNTVMEAQRRVTFSDGVFGDSPPPPRKEPGGLGRTQKELEETEQRKDELEREVRSVWKEVKEKMPSGATLEEMRNESRRFDCLLADLAKVKRRHQGLQRVLADRLKV
uniref:protein-L-isoaspartate(D-aspartate) O-methyltransferase n=1 Tax=Chromera velia CCMP2878 TaxID=1169474 RepID=A0A0G4HMU2_9ALVE|eukprot:Cvel_7561.t1-p1 / transcript=Cvel_7561.t1 / gene=Cvel_7561 / organism=Chromera_velia_CCMP2878 / gene_product=Protein-L-isoaspartate O-methyltransferase, putative / transcript_product=Protein-L-isoaspartate O-methyltransferase, putative / location=Cvel_scaffold398:1460-4438(+) / protein_length=362 / sequence_SO=supercontig / SO=protein_coding / is_pseudo=false